MSAGCANPVEPSRSARAEASVWIVRLYGEERTPELEAGLRAWLAADPENKQEFELLTEVWNLGGAIDANGLPRMRSWGALESNRRRAPMAIVAAMAAIAAMAVLAGVGPWTNPSFATKHGEQRLVRLADGSRISMNSDTRLEVAFGDGERRVLLKRGEALFEVAKEPARPFVVHAGDKHVTVLGTTFVVRYERKRTDVTLVEGKVAVGNGPATAEALVMTPGQRMSFASSRAPEIDAPRIEALIAWRRGEVLLDGTPLSEAVVEMNRYDERQLVIDEPRLAAVRVSGVYRTGDSTGFARAVAELHGLVMVEEHQRIHLRAAAR